VLAVLVTFATGLDAQDPAALGQEGNNAVWNGSRIAPSTAYVDASRFYASSGLDICQVINNILRSASGYGTYPLNGTVVDARGIIAAKAQLPLPCAINPFSGVGATTPSTILLPGTRIAIQTTWVYPATSLRGYMCKLFHTSANSRMGVRSGPLLEPRSLGSS
jgi:hypothetical protein